MYHGVTQKGKRPVETPRSREPEPSSEDASRDDKKERVLHTRVPAVLEQELKRFAQNLRVPVSNLVRTILEDALEVADAAGDRVEERLRKAATQLQSERERLRRKLRADPLVDVYAFQEVTLAQPTHCAKCDVELPKGAHAHLGLIDPGTSDGPSKLFVCEKCLPHVHEDLDNEAAATPQEEEPS
jgi:hypothetical protein